MPNAKQKTLPTNILMLLQNLKIVIFAYSGPAFSSGSQSSYSFLVTFKSCIS